jgi:serine/threonine protein kinase
VLGAIFTDKVVVQCLTDFIWVGMDTTLNEQHCYRVARILHPLGRSIVKLNKYYLGLKLDNIGIHELQTRYLPSICAYRDASVVIVNFAYVKPWERDATCVTFLAKTLKASPKSIAVKFVEHYGVAAHKLLEKIYIAPRLLYYDKVGINDDDLTYGRLRMVVMEYLDGMTANQAQKLDQLPPTFLEDVQIILSHLHDNDLVFGDARSANIVITRNHKVTFVDFDWAGKAGVSRYPLLLSQHIQWPDGVGDGLAVMEKQHDLETA